MLVKPFGRVLAAASAVLALLVVAAPASAGHVQCGDVLLRDTTLDSDLTCSANALTIGADGVALDLDGNTIEGTTGALGIGFYAGGDAGGLTVRGGTIRGFSIAIRVDGPSGTAVEDMVLEHNGIGFDCHYAPGCRIADSVVRNNGGGIRFAAVDSGCRPRAVVTANQVHHNEVGVRLAGCGTDVTGNRIERNSTRGVRIEDHGLVEVSGNVIARNGTEGVHVTYLATVDAVGNRIAANGADGIHFDGDSGPYGPGGTVRRNRVTRNGADGVHATNAYGLLIEQNRAERNGDDGIDIDIGEFGGDVTVRANRAFFNLDLGIEADLGTMDGGGNRAKHNGNPAQCVGVQCS